MQHGAFTEYNKAIIFYRQQIYYKNNETINIIEPKADNQEKYLCLFEKMITLTSVQIEREEQFNWITQQLNTASLNP